MQRRNHPYLYVALGGILAALPFLGFPAPYENAFEIGVGLYLVAVGLTMWWSARRNQPVDTFMESVHSVDEPHRASAPQVVASDIRPVAPKTVPAKPRVSPPATPSDVSPRVAAPKSAKSMEPAISSENKIPTLTTASSKKVESPAPEAPAERTPPRIEVKEAKEAPEEGALAKTSRTSKGGGSSTARTRTARRKSTTTRRRSTKAAQEPTLVGGFSAGNWE